MHWQFSWLILQVGPGVEIVDSGGGGGGGVLTGVLVGVFLVALAVGIFFFVRWSQDQKLQGPASLRNLPRDKRKRIDEALKEGRSEEAGDLFSRVSLHQEAAEQFVKAGAHVKAAKSFLAAGNRAQAIHHFKQAKEFAQAARLYAEDKQHRSAAAEYVQADDLEHAAEQYALCEDWARAAEYFEQVERWQRAADAYEAAGEPLKAAMCFERHFDPESKAEGEALSDEERQLIQRTATLLMSAGEVDRAISLFERADFYQEAASALSETGEHSRAADMLLKAGDTVRAARLLDEAGDRERASLLRAEQALADGRTGVAAEEFRSAGAYSRAAELFSQMERWEEAAQLYEHDEKYEQAVDLFVRAGRFAHAARCAEALAQFPRAAELYEQANDMEGQLRALKEMGDFFHAGRILFEHRQYMESLKTLNLIEADDPLYPQALELQGDVYSAQGRHEKAYSRYKSALGKRRLQSSTIHLYYKMAVELQEVDQRASAQIFEAVLELDPNYEDATSRLQSLRGISRRTSNTGQIKTSGIFTAEEGTRRYEIIEEAARGGMGVVYRARDTVLGRIVAFKILGENLRDNETAVKYFLREARAAAALSHPNIVTIYDAGEQDGEFYMAMEFIEGTTIKELVRRVGAMPDDQVRYIAHHCCAALQYAHSKGVIHRDIKSGNVMITRDRTLKVMDFGLAKFLREYQKDHTQQVGTPFYMSPEQIIGRDVDFRSDLYSLGCMAFECATGVVPFRDGDLTYHHLHSEPPRPSSVNPNVSAELEEVILKLLQKKPDDRYQSARHVMRALALQM